MGEGRREEGNLRARLGDVRMENKAEVEEIERAGRRVTRPEGGGRKGTDVATHPTTATAGFSEAKMPASHDTATPDLPTTATSGPTLPKRGPCPTRQSNVFRLQSSSELTGNKSSDSWPNRPITALNVSKIPSRYLLDPVRGQGAPETLPCLQCTTSHCIVCKT